MAVWSRAGETECGNLHDVQDMAGLETRRVGAVSSHSTRVFQDKNVHGQTRTGLIVPHFEKAYECLKQPWQWQGKVRCYDVMANVRSRLCESGFSKPRFKNRMRIGERKGEGKKQGFR